MVEEHGHGTWHMGVHAEDTEPGGGGGPRVSISQYVTDALTIMESRKNHPKRRVERGAVS